MGTFFFAKGSPLGRISPDICHITIYWCALDIVRYEEKYFVRTEVFGQQQKWAAREQLSKQMWFLLLSFSHLT